MELLCNISGQDAVYYAIKELHQECHLLGPVILKMFFEVRELSKIEKEIAGWSKNVATRGNTERLDPQEVAFLLDEAQALLQVGEERLAYTVAMVARAHVAGARLSLEEEHAFQFGPFRQALQELFGTYVILEEFTMKANVRKAIERNKLGVGKLEPEGLTSSVVDDILPVLQSSSRRALCTCNAQAMSATMDVVRNIILNNEYKDALLGKTLETNLDEKLFEAGRPVMEMGCEVAALLNSLDTSALIALDLWREARDGCLQLVFLSQPISLSNVVSLYLLSPMW